MEKKRLIFNPTISFDGVAIVVACVTCSVWFGSISATIKQHTEDIRHLNEITTVMARTEEASAQNLAVLTTIVNERMKAARP